MIQVYASHAITIEVRQDRESREWTPEVNIRSVTDPTGTFRTLPVRPITGTKAEAESYALAAAKRWIDAGKPDLLPEQ